MTNLQNPQIWGVGSGKGGIGKSVIALGLAMMLQQMKKKVVIADCNLGSPNLHSRFGITRPKKTINDFLSNPTSSLEDMLIDIPNSVGEGALPNIKLLAGSPGKKKLTDIQPHHTRRLIAGIQKLRTDYVIMDLSPNPDRDTLDMYDIADKKLLALHVDDKACVESNHSFLVAYMYKKLSELLLNHEGKKITKYKSDLDFTKKELLENPDSDTLKIKIEKLNKIYKPLKDMQDFIKESQDPSRLDTYSESFTEFLVKLKIKNEKSYQTITKNILPKFKPLLVITRAKSYEEIERGKKFFPVAMKQLVGIDMVYAGYISESPDIAMSAKTGRHFMHAGNTNTIDQFKALCKNILFSDRTPADLNGNSEIYKMQKGKGFLDAEERTKLIRHCNARFSGEDRTLKMQEKLKKYGDALNQLKILQQRRPEIKPQLQGIFRPHRNPIINDFYEPLLERTYSNLSVRSDEIVQKTTKLLVDFGIEEITLRSVAERARNKFPVKG